MMVLGRPGAEFPQTGASAQDLYGSDRPQRQAFRELGDDLWHSTTSIASSLQSQGSILLPRLPVLPHPYPPMSSEKQTFLQRPQTSGVHKGLSTTPHGKATAGGGRGLRPIQAAGAATPRPPQQPKPGGIAVPQRVGGTQSMPGDFGLKPMSMTQPISMLALKPVPPSPRAARSLTGKPSPDLSSASIFDRSTHNHWPSQRGHRP